MAMERKTAERGILRHVCCIFSVHVFSVSSAAAGGRPISV